MKRSKRVITVIVTGALLVGALIGGVVVGGCAPIPANQDPNMPLQVSVTDHWLQGKFYARMYTPERVGSGQLKVNMDVYNKTDFELTMDYKPRFKDARGVQVDNEVGWQLVRIAPKGYSPVSFTSMSAMAEDFEVQFRRAQ